MPGDWIRPALVLDVRLMTDARDETEWADVTVCYGTDERNVPIQDRLNNLHIRHHEYRALGLHKPTIFKLDPRRRLRRPWGDDYFVSQGYMRNENIVAGSLTPQQQATVKTCLVARGLIFPLP